MPVKPRINEARQEKVSMMARGTTRSNQRPDTLMQDRICQVDETSCNARPDHTLGQKETCRPLSRTSALPLKADSERTSRHVREVPNSSLRGPFGVNGYPRAQAVCPLER